MTISLWLAVVLATPAVSLDEPVRWLRGFDLGAACRDEENLVSTEICYAYLHAIAQRQITHTATSDAAAPYCFPQDLTRRQLVTAVRRHMRRAPGDLEQTADVFVAGAFTAAFPCE